MITTIVTRNAITPISIVNKNTFDKRKRKKFIILILGKWRN